jgi:hypothetical protein
VTNTSKRLGTLWETAIVAFLNASGWPYAERRALNGNQDKGDITGIPGGPVIEAKNAARIQLAEWTKETEAEVKNAGAPFGALWIKRRGKSSPADGYVVLSGSAFVHLLKAGGY